MYKIMTIVGNSFVDFAKNEMVILYDDVKEIIHKRVPYVENIKYDLGQGVSEHGINQLINDAENSGLRSYLLFNEVKKCQRRHVHKIDARNSMISMPIETDKNTYESNIHIDDENELMSDHITGQHLQGMLLTEACRQMFLAVTEEFFSDNEQEIMSFAWTRGDVVFHDYAFPVSTIIRFYISHIENSKKGRCKYTSNIEIIQKNSVVCTSIMEYETLPHKVTSRRETILASASVT